MANSALLAGVLGLVLVLLLALGIQFLGGGDILLPATCCYLGWQAQETMRRCLLANFRYRAAVAGDAVSFIGQAVAIALMAWLGTVTLSSALYAMSATFVAGALVHASKLHFGRANVAQAIRLARDYFALGKWSLVYYEVLHPAPAAVPMGACRDRGHGGDGGVPGRGQYRQRHESHQPRDRQRHSAGRGPCACDRRRPRQPGAQRAATFSSACRQFSRFASRASWRLSFCSGSCTVRRLPISTPRSPFSFSSLPWRPNMPAR